MSRIFIDRPIFAWVIAIIVMLAGLAAIRFLPIAQYPDVAPPQVIIRATFPGASAQTIQNSVTQVIEQSLTGLDGLLYFQSSATSRGTVNITVTFVKGTSPDIAQVQVQNQVAQAVPRLPQQVQAQGLIVRKSNPDNLMLVGVYDETDRLTNIDVADYLASNLQEPIGRIEGVGDSDVFGTQYAMRIWLNPVKLASFQLMPIDVFNAITAQNAEVAAGEVGGTPSADTQMLNASVTAQSRLQTPQQFRDVVLKTQNNGAVVKVSDVARVELGAENYNAIARVNGHPSAGINVNLSPGADALATADRIKTTVDRIAAGFPPGLKVTYANDSTAFIVLSVREVVETLIEAIILVVIVMFVFLKSWRATLVPAVAVPVVLLGTFAVLYLAHYSINTMTLFGLVLAIGLLVDDAIVVVENVERLLKETPGMSARDATIQSMDEISVALVAIALVLSAVFLPMALFGGSTGVIYRQFSITVVTAMVLSVMVALILSPALTANLLLPHRDDHHENPGFIARHLPWLSIASRKFDEGFDKLSRHYVSSVKSVIKHAWWAMLIYAIVVVVLALLFLHLPTGFLPSEDQGRALVQWRLPPGATMSRTVEVQKQIEQYFLTQEKDNVSVLFTSAGGGGGGVNGQNTGQGFMNLSDWDQRKGYDNSADGIMARSGRAFAGLRDAQVFPLVPPSIRGLGQSGGFTMELQNTGNLSFEDFNKARDQLLEVARKDPVLSTVRLTELPDVATLRVDTDASKLAALGLTQANVNDTLSTAWGGKYVNDFVDRGRVKRVYVQGDAPYRSQPSDIAQWQVRGTGNQMVPFSSFATTAWSQAPTTLSRFNGIQSYEFNGQASPGYSSGDAMNRIAALAAQVKGTDISWAALSYQERLSAGQGPTLYAMSLVVVFLCLAALYESWSVPVAVLLVVPLGLVGAVVAVTLRGLDNDVYLQIGLLTTMGLAAKNAILIVEFAEQAERSGKSPLDSAIEAAQLRLRPILMTSLAFVFGVLPLAISHGAGANSRIAIGTAVIGGMATATLLAIFYIPLFFVLVRNGAKWVGRKLGHKGRDHGHGEGGDLGDGDAGPHAEPTLPRNGEPEGA